MLDRSQLEDTLSQLPGVISARVLGDPARLEEVHVLADGTRHPKQVARDVETCLAAKFGVEIDHRRISVAQVDPAESEEVRLLVESVSVRLEGPEVEAEVGLRLGDRRFVGRARGPVSSRQRLLLAAKATAQAVEEAVGKKLHVVAEDVGRYDVGGEPVVLSLVILSDGRRDEALVGSAYVRRDEAEAAVRATLSGLNRRLGLHLEGSDASAPL